MSQDHSERQLLLALLAFQTNFIDRAKLLAAFDVWSQDKSRSFAALLVEQGAISDDERQLLEGLVARHVARFHNDVQQSLAHVSSLHTSVRDELQKIASPDLQASLKIVGRDADPYATVAPTVGESTSDGTRFKILRPHARGGLGEVFVAADGELPREVALKQIQARHADDADSRARFLQEAEITGGLEHPNIVPVYGLGTYADGRPFYAMRFIRGDSLQDAVKRYHNRVPGDGASRNDPVDRTGVAERERAAEVKREPPAERSIQFRKLLQRFIDVCNAIDYAHSRGILHRDLKPGNIMLGKYGETLVVDWGLAKAVGRQSDETITSEERTLKPSGGSGSVETAYGAAIGTPAYMSPEQAAGRLDELGPASDVYSLGATLYEVLTGQPPFKGIDLGAMLREVQQGRFSAPRTINREIPKPLEAICLKAMSLKPGDRYSSARALADDIEHWLADEPTTAHRETFGERVTRWTKTHRTAVASAVALTATAVVALVVGLVAVSAEQRETEKQRLTAEAAKTEEAAQRTIAEQKQLDAEQAQAKEAEERKRADEQRDLAVAASARSNYFLADARWKAGRVSEAQELLAAVPPERRHFEWRLAHREYQGSDITLSGHTDWVWSVTFSPDGARLASASQDDTIKLWDSRTGEELRTLHGHTGTVTSAAFSPDGARLASASIDKTVKLWDARTGEKLRTLTGHTSSVASVAFSPDGARLASASEDKTIKLWDAQTGTVLHTLAGHTSSVASVAFSPDGARLASACRNKTIKLWDARTGEELRTLAGHEGPVTSVAFSPDGARLASASYDNMVKLWDTQTGEELRTLTGHTSYVNSVAFSPDGARLASASGDTIKLWNARTGEELRTLTGHTDSVQSVAFSPDGARLASASWDRTIKVWDARSGAVHRTLNGHTGPVTNLVFSRDGSCLASASIDNTTMRITGSSSAFAMAGSSNNTIKLWDARSGEIIRSLTGNSGGVAGMAFSPDGSRLASGSNNAIKLWDMRARAEIRTLTGHAGFVGAVCFKPDDLCLASGSTDGTIKFWDARSGAEIHTLTGHGGLNYGMAFSPGAARFAFASRDHTIRIWDANTGAEVRTLIGHRGPVLTMAFSPDAARLASAGLERNIRIWDTHSGAEIRTLTGHSGSVLSVAFSPDGSRLATAGSDMTIKIWDSHSGTELRTLTGHSSSVLSTAFSPDGSRLATASADHTINIWEAPMRSEHGDVRNAIGIIDLKFKDDPDEKAYREFKARLDPWWHTEQAWAADLNTPIGPIELREAPSPLSQISQQSRDNKPQPDWYAAAFHWAWVVKAYLDKPDKAEQLKEARERLKFCDAKWRVEFAARSKEVAVFAEKFAQPEKPPTPVSTKPDDYLQPIVREMLKK